MVVVVQTPIHTPTRTHTCSHTHTHTQGAGRRCLEGASPGGLGSSCPRLCTEPQAWHQATSGRHSARQVTSDMTSDDNNSHSWRCLGVPLEPCTLFENRRFLSSDGLAMYGRMIPMTTWSHPKMAEDGARFLGHKESWNRNSDHVTPLIPWSHVDLTVPNPCSGP